jgi:hypothetical protein
MQGFYAQKGMAVSTSTDCKDRTCPLDAFTKCKSMMNRGCEMEMRHGDGAGF